MTRKRYGLPYMGSKNAIAKDIVDLLPQRENLYDLFCGGGAIIDRALEIGKFKHIYANDLNKLTIKALKMAFNGEFKEENRWISREDFFKLKDTDPYAFLCFSFANGGMTYTYSKEIEPWKRALHYARVLNDFSLFKEMGIDTDKADKQSIREHDEEYKRKYIDWYCRTYNASIEVSQRMKDLQSLESLQRLERLERLESLESLQSLSFTSKDYREIKIKENSIIYCDIPYANSNKGYVINGKVNKHFDYDAFYDWCEKQTEPLLISSYELPKERFTEFFSKHKRVVVGSAKFGSTRQEKLFYPKTQEHIFNTEKRTSLFVEKEENKLVELIGHYGSDETITNSARMSFNANKEHTQEENERLLRFMLENGHTSPFEQVNFSFKLHMPIFVARQWQRHRTAKINEQSARYTQLNCEFFKLDKNNIRTSKELKEEEEETLVNELNSYYETSANLYKNLLNLGIVKEQARTILPLATYTTFIWQMDLHNLLHFLQLRLSNKAQKETRDYAEEILRQIEEYCPITIKLFKEIVLKR